MNLPNQKPGDLYLLFHSLPYDFEQDLPLLLGPGICLDNTPQIWLDSAEKGLADYLLPGYNLEGGITHCCLRCFSSPSQEDLLFLALICLRLHLPLFIKIGGQFCLGDDENRILDPKLYELYSPWSTNGRKFYTPASITKSSTIMNKILEIDKLNCSRLTTGFIFFSHVTLGISQSFQLSYLGLFSALEALYAPSKYNAKNKADSLSQRISNFLCNFKFPKPINKWIKDEYINSRHNLAHGIHDAIFGTRLSAERYQNFGLLLEITRLSLLGFLSMDSAKLIELSKCSGSSLQRELNNLDPASGDLLDGQRCWAI